MKKILFGLAGGALLALAILPSTRWVPKAQVVSLARATLGMPSVYSSLLSEMGVTENNYYGRPVYPSPVQQTTDGDIAIANATRPTDANYERPLRDLIKRFPNEPAAYGAYLRNFGDSFGTGRLTKRRDYRAIDPGRKWPHSSALLNRTPQSVYKEMESAAIRGHALDPANAFFPMMQASCYYSQYRDTEGDRQMLIASRCPKYEDYVKNESLGEQKSLERAYGEPGMPLRIAAWSSITFPYFGEMRDLGQLVVYRAMKSEVAGNVKQGVALRMSVLHCGSLMRSQGPIPICNFVGISLTTIAANRPGGAQPIDSVKTSKAGYFTGAPYSSSLALQNELKEKHRARLISYLRIHGFDYEAKIVKHEYQSCDKAQAIIKDGAIQNFFLLVIPPMLTSLVSSLILAVIAFLGVLWIAAVLLSRLTMMKERQRLSPGAASAVLISVPYALFLSLISVEPQEWGLYFTPLLCIAIVCVASYIMKWQTMGCFTKTLAFSTSALTVIFFFATNGVRSYPPVMQFWSIINGLSVG